MNDNITLTTTAEKLREVDPRMLSYNIEMTEVTGGTFWKEYTPAQIAGTEDFPPFSDMRDVPKMMQLYPPADLGGARIRSLAAALGSVYVRVSGSWATNTYYDFDGHCEGKTPAGYQSILTRERWQEVLNFVQAVDAKLLISAAVCNGAVQPDGRSWSEEQVKLLLDFSKSYGVPVDAVELMNEPNAAAIGGGPDGYTAEKYAHDQDAFYRFMRENYPNVLLVGPCACGDDTGIGVEANIKMWQTPAILELCTEKPDVFSYHSYNGISERGAFMGRHWADTEATSEEYLSVVARVAKYYAQMRDKYVPGAPMWVTETADAGCGGNTWGSTFLDVIRYANELGCFGEITDGVLFHNTLASSDYGLLDHKTHMPRPNYWLALLWNTLMGTAVYLAPQPADPALHLYARSRRDGRPGMVYLAINAGREDSLALTLATPAQRYTLTGKALRSRDILLNGEPLALNAGNILPAIAPAAQPAGEAILPPCSVSFFVL